MTDEEITNYWKDEAIIARAHDTARIALDNLKEWEFEKARAVMKAKLLNDRAIRIAKMA